ncbi:hypothetical protein QZH41_007693 [Actinostola sp. cb2023]|nr:hypothetical protein QZH41_007693 [Actinostola sp. cb2023]
MCWQLVTQIKDNTLFYWGIEEANVMCRMLGFKAAKNHHFFQPRNGSAKQWFTGVDCNGNEARISDCSNQGKVVQQCFQNRQTGVICENDEVKYPNVAVRLVDADGDAPNRGRVEVRYHGVWGTVSVFKWSKYYSKYEHNNVHHVICRLLGYKSGIKFELVRTNGKGPLLMSNVDCSGNETSIEQCSHRGWGETSYRNYELEVHCEDGIPGNYDDTTVQLD